MGRPFGIVGTWTAKVTLPDFPEFPEDLERLLFAFRGDGNFFGLKGGDKIIGFGTWRSTGGNSLEMEFRRNTVNNEGQVSGWAYIRQTGTLITSQQFIADGPASEYDLAGNLTLSAQTHTVGTRYGFLV